MQDKNLHILREKVNELQSALFTSTGESILKIPTSIVSILKVDELAQLWFFIPKPVQSIYQFDKYFPCNLRFYKKGKSFYINIEGNAYIMYDPEEINSLQEFDEDTRQKALCDFVLVKVKISSAGFFQERNYQSYPLMEWMREQMYKWLFNQRPGYKPYHLYTDSNSQLT
jgi:hypothetical protein